MPKSVNLSEEGDVDILSLYTEIGDTMISIAGCPDADSFISAIFSGRINNVMQIILNKQEAKLIIEALTKLLQDK